MKNNRLPIDEIIFNLGYTSSDNFFLYDELDSAPLSLRLKKTIKEMNPYAMFVLDNAPFVLFFDQQINNHIMFKEISKVVWNAQIPVAIFCDESTVKICTGMSLNIADYTIKQIETNPIEACNEHSNFSYWRISDPLFWEQYSQDFSYPKLNQSLLDNISHLTETLKNTYHIPFATKLVLRLIFIRYLIDRGVDLDYKNFSTNIEASQKEFLEIIKKKELVYDLFNHLKAKFNGNLFEVGTELDCLELTENVFTLLSDFFSGKEELNSKQLSMFPLYDFNIIPVELISNIYEILLGKEAQKKDNAFYTPNYLVEYILDKTVTKTLKEKASFTILDPSCGSGVFLVDSYRRMIQENLGEKLYCDDDSVLKQLLTDHIYGIDVNEEAIDVTIFSLYLTILDYKDPKTLSGFTLPNLKGTNLFVNDFFDEDGLQTLTEKNITFDYIIGNPPWGSVKTGLHMSYCNEKGFADKQQNSEISRSFVFRAKDFCTVNTICCFVLHSKLLYNQKGPAVRFRKFLLKETEICDIVEMSAVRRLVFEHANAPAAIIAFRYNDQNNLEHVFNYTSVKPNIFFRLFHVICIEKNDIKRIPQSLLFTYDWAWKTIVYGFSADFENILKIKREFPAIKRVLKESKPAMISGDGIQTHIGDGQDASELLGLPLLDSDNGVDHFSLNLNDDSFFHKPRIHRIRNRELFKPPHCFIAKGVDCDSFKMRSAYSDKEMVCKDAMRVIKGTAAQKDILFNLVGLFNSSFFAYLNLMLGSSIGIEREQRFASEVLSFPYTFSQNIVDAVKNIQTDKERLLSTEDNSKVSQLDEIILSAFGLDRNKFVDYAINVTIPELTGKNKNTAYRKVTISDLREYSKCFINQFSLVYNPIGKYILVKLYPDICNYYAAFELHICDRRSANETVVVNEDDTEKNLLARFSVYEHNDRFYQIRDVLHFAEDSFFIIKPNFYKNWHPAIAENDLADTIDQIMSDSGGAE